MALKKIKLPVAQGKKPTDPQEIFNKLTLRGSIENIWQPQGEALKKWQGKRSDSDVVVQINTGGGKTLVGLLIAQSIVNETKGRVLYVCPNNQLVEQIVDRAKEVGLIPAIRYNLLVLYLINLPNTLQNEPLTFQKPSKLYWYLLSYSYKGCE